MKLIQLILIIFTIVCNEIVVELVVSDELKISILDNTSEENTESENTEVETEAEVDFANDHSFIVLYEGEEEKSNIDNSISRITNAFLEIHSPPPDFT